MIFRSSHRRLSDADLVADVAQGDERAFAELLHRHQNAVYAFACRMLQDPQEAEDVTQETFLRLYQTSRRYRPTASLRAYLLRITKNICIDHFRKKRPELMDDLPDPATPQTPQDLLEGAVTTKYLEKAIDRLPVNQRTALLLRHTEQLSVQPDRRGHGRIYWCRRVFIGACPPNTETASGRPSGMKNQLCNIFLRRFLVCRSL